MNKGRLGFRCGIVMVLMAMVAAAMASTPGKTACEKVVMQGEVTAGQEWRAPIGEGWVFRVLPIDTGKPEPEKAGYSGWDLVVDREQPAGFPDGLLLATPPYDSINEREVGTTFGMRAQDVIGWNPRSFRFLTTLASFQAAQRAFLSMNRVGRDRATAAGAGSEATAKLMAIAQDSAAGQFQILDARLTPGIADAAPFAENWATQATRTPHTFESAPSGKSTQLGRLGWIRFSITLWLPPAWKTPAVLGATRAACSE